MTDTNLGANLGTNLGANLGTNLDLDDEVFIGADGVTSDQLYELIENWNEISKTLLGAASGPQNAIPIEQLLAHRGHGE